MDVRYNLSRMMRRGLATRQGFMTGKHRSTNSMKRSSDLASHTHPGVAGDESDCSPPSPAELPWLTRKPRFEAHEKRNSSTNRSFSLPFELC